MNWSLANNRKVNLDKKRLELKYPLKIKTNKVGGAAKRLLL